MYPLLRSAALFLRIRGAPAVAIDTPVVTRHRVWPQDIDPLMELNHGRTLTLFDMGRGVLFFRTGLWRAAKTEGWGIAVAGASVRYRRRVRMFETLTQTAVMQGRDARFFYLTQTFARGDDATAQALYRLAVTSPEGIVPTERVMLALGQRWAPDLPAWIIAWAEAEALRPWPPIPVDES